MTSRNGARSQSPSSRDGVSKKDYAPTNPSHLREFEYPPDTPKPGSLPREGMDYFGKASYVDNNASGTITGGPQGGNAFLPDGRPNHAAIRRLTDGPATVLEGVEGEESPEAPGTPLGYHSDPATPGYGGFFGDSGPKAPDTVNGIPTALNDGLLPMSKKTLTGWMAQRHGVSHDRLMYAYLGRKIQD